MNKKTNIAILDLGSYKIKGVLSTFSPDGKIQQLIAAREFSQGIESGFIKNKRMTANCISNIFSKLERKTDKNIDFTYIVLNDSLVCHLYFKFFSFLCFLQINPKCSRNTFFYIYASHIKSFSFF